MDEMKQLGIKRVSFLIEYNLKKDSVSFKVTQTFYCADYGGRLRIKNSKILRSIEKTGLESHLKAAILARVQNSEFAKLRKRHGIASPDEFEALLFDDESLPLSYLVF